MSCQITPEQIDAILPQTQCGLCGYGGCMPYANALIHEKAAINLCPPGGVKGLKAIANLLNEDATPFMAEMEKNAKPKLLAIIREAECIGCTKCIQACPVDAILGSAKNMHTIIADECTGCELCVLPCPVDCIDIVAIPAGTEEQEKQKATVARGRFQFRTKRLEQDNEKDPTLKMRTGLIKNDSVEEKKSYIQEAILRAKMKKSQV
jgi:electron transport complex protein RnfB